MVNPAQSLATDVRSLDALRAKASTDPKAAVLNVANYEDRLYEDVQLSARRFLATRSLDQILKDRNELSEAIQADISGPAKQFGVTVLRLQPIVTTYATSFKSVGLNLNGVPTDAQDRPVLSAATVKPEDVRHVELGIKTAPFRGVTANLAV